MIVFLIVNKKGHAESPEELISYYNFCQCSTTMASPSPSPSSSVSLDRAILTASRHVMELFLKEPETALATLAQFYEDFNRTKAFMPHRRVSYIHWKMKDFKETMNDPDLSLSAFVDARKVLTFEILRILGWFAADADDSQFMIVCDYIAANTPDGGTKPMTLSDSMY